MTFSIEKVAVTARSRQLEATWTIEVEEEPFEADEEWVADVTRDIVFNVHADNWNWTQWHRASRRERLKILGYSEK